MTTWAPDLLGDGYEQTTFDLGPDPDGEGGVVATLVRYRPAGTPPGRRAVLYVHGFTDYFFQTHLAEHFHGLGYDFFALDLRKCGRSRRPGQTPHYVSDLALYDLELDRALETVRDEVRGGPVVFVGHSTGGLILPMWLDRLNRRPGGCAAAGAAGLILNSPWFDLQGPWYVRNVGTVAIRTVGRFKATLELKQPPIDVYGRTLHRDHGGEWDYDLEWKPLRGFGVTFGWLRAVRRAQAVLHRGLDIGVPSLILRSKATHYSMRLTERSQVSDLVLDVRQIARWAGCLGDRTTIVPIEGARHDVFLSRPEPRAEALGEVDQWLGWLEGTAPTELHDAMEGPA